MVRISKPENVSMANRVAWAEARRLAVEALEE